MNPWKLLEPLYTKTRPYVDGLELGAIIALNQWLSLVPEQCRRVSELMDYFFYISPEHYYYLLYFTVKGKYTFIKKPSSLDMSQNLLLSKVQYILGWTDRELRLNRQVLKETILKNEVYWKQQLGVQ